jgi:hypothetical protein
MSHPFHLAIAMTMRNRLIRKQAKKMMTQRHQPFAFAFAKLYVANTLGQMKCLGHRCCWLEQWESGPSSDCVKHHIRLTHRIPVFFLSPQFLKRCILRLRSSSSLKQQSFTPQAMYHRYSLLDTRVLVTNPFQGRYGR